MRSLPIFLAIALVAGSCALLPAATTAVDLNLKNNQLEVKLDQALTLQFSRAVDPQKLALKFEVAPATEGDLAASRDGTRFTWTPVHGWLEATLYRVFVYPFSDRKGNSVTGRNWTFLTTITPRVLAVNDASGQQLAEGDDTGQGRPLTLAFNAPMSAADTNVTANGTAAQLTWADDRRSAAVATSELPIGDLTLALIAGKDQLGHRVPAGWVWHVFLSYTVNIATHHLPFPALVQIPNDGYGSRPQVGIQAAAMVFEYQTEGSIQRLTALYTDAPDVVGPTRSGREISFRLVRHYHGNLFLSGLSNDARAHLRADPVPAWFDNPPGFYRDYSRSAPNNLMLRGDEMLRLEQASGVTDFAPIKTGKVELGTAADAATSFGVDEHRSTYTYDPLTGTYSKVEDGETMSDASLGKPDQIFMVIVLHTREFLVADIESGCCTHGRDFDLDSGGPIDVYHRGKHVAGTWSAADRSSPLVFKTASGQELLLPQGLVWVDVVGN
jgi:hypothetical protein